MNCFVGIVYRESSFTFLFHQFYYIIHFENSFNTVSYNLNKGSFLS